MGQVLAGPSQEAGNNGEPENSTKTNKSGWAEYAKVMAE